MVHLAYDEFMITCFVHKLLDYCFIQSNPPYLKQLQLFITCFSHQNNNSKSAKSKFFCFVFETESYNVDQAGLEPKILLPLKYWDYKCAQAQWALENNSYFQQDAQYPKQCPVLETLEGKMNEQLNVSCILSGHVYVKM